MTVNNDALRELRDSTLRKKHLEATLKNLYTLRDNLQHSLIDLDLTRTRELEDANRLHPRHSPLALLYMAMGKLDDKLDMEQSEAYAAAVKYDVALKQSSSVDLQILDIKKELSALSGCEEKYTELLARKFSELKASGHKKAEELYTTEEVISFTEHQIKEINEALPEGKRALEIVRTMYNNLSSAEQWGIWDMVGGGIIASAVKYDNLDQAQRYAEKLQSQLQKFQAELTDITIRNRCNLQIDEFTRFADYFFDGLFMDWTVQGKINNSQTQVKQTESEIESAIDHLNTLLTEAEENHEIAKRQFEDMLLSIS